ncbi:hypothetical protein CkaCkLH20_03616 [Colletotrichum karsti]|uniref:Uncharacterized protein n=1 Tax=Colletotrichum karsti TaxID=1095194 RepID=A0A9P6LN05_9PEZI|nr:uncharacterized protein CkaCkLH20_03616 [Colletotrichum karsti]KAF9878716.1 hypothetical protein CkaCkLH20_03616 [Colletotrichum karsti]
MRIASNAILRAAFVAAWLASTALAMPQVVDREDPPPNPPSPPKPVATADQVDVTRPNTTTAGDENKPPIPITVQLFGSSPGVKNCRSGAKLVDMELPKNASALPQFTAGDLGQCYDLPGTAQCGIFMGNKADGCEAKLFRGLKCTSFTNVAVFQDELRPVGGFFTSMAIKCGIKPVEVQPLSLGGLGAAKMQKPQTKDGGKARAARAIDAAMQAGLSQGAN